MTRHTLRDITAALDQQKKLANTIEALNRVLVNQPDLANTLAERVGFADRKTLLTYTAKVQKHLSEQVEHIADSIAEFKLQRLDIESLAARAGYNPERYIAVIRPCAVRDVQICTNACCDPMHEETWYDNPDSEIYLGVFNGPEQKALTEAAKYANTSEHNIQLYPI